jgi:hypothetical protein
MLLLIEALGPDYIVWDKSAEIRFKKPGRGRVRARFHIEESAIEEIKKTLLTTRKIEPRFATVVLDDEDTVIAEVEKLLYVRKRADDPR